MTLVLDDLVSREAWAGLHGEVLPAAQSVIERAAPTFEALETHRGSLLMAPLRHTGKAHEDEGEGNEDSRENMKQKQRLEREREEDNDVGDACEDASKEAAPLSLDSVPKQEGIAVLSPGVVTESTNPEVHVDGSALKFFETNKKTSDSTVGVYLRMPRAPGLGALDHERRGNEELWMDTQLFRERFPKLRAFVESEVKGKLLTQVGRIWLIYDASGRDGIAHRDHSIKDFRSEFVWFKIGAAKTIAVRASKEKHLQPMDGFACWFDSRFEHQAKYLLPGSGEPAISLRIDGYFTDAVRERLRDYPDWKEDRA